MKRSSPVTRKTASEPTVVAASTQEVPSLAAASTQPQQKLVTVERFDGRSWRAYFYTHTADDAALITKQLKLVGAPGIQYRLKP